MSGLILLRSHFVDARVLELARLYAAGGDYDVRIALDETLGDIDAGGFPKLPMTLNSCARLGLDVAHDNPLWRCGDYLFYHALQLDKAYDFIWSIEYDITINLDHPLDFFRRLDAQAPEDYLTTFLQIAEPKWIWRKAAAKRFQFVYGSGFALVRLTREAARKLLARRRFEAAIPRYDPLARNHLWINDETFVSSAIPDLGMSMADINAHGEVYNLGTLQRRGVLHPAQLPAPDGKIYHAVRTGATYLKAASSYYSIDLEPFLRYADATLAEFPIAATAAIFQALNNFADDPLVVFGPQGPLSSALPHFREPHMCDALLRALAQRRLRLCIEAIQFGRLPLTFGRGASFDNIALGRPAWQSSTSARSRSRDRRRDAEFGVDGDISVDYGFLTLYEDAPWWVVDLGQIQAVAHVRVFNRKLHPYKLRGFEIEGSPDFQTWTRWHVHDEVNWHELRAEPQDIALNPPREARYLRIRLPRKGVLHLTEVEAIRACP